MPLCELARRALSAVILRVQAKEEILPMARQVPVGFGSRMLAPWLAVVATVLGLGACEAAGTDAELADMSVDQDGEEAESVDSSGREGGTTVTCEETSTAFASSAAELVAGSTVCETDEDCTLLTPELICTDVGVELRECPMAVAVNDTQVVTGKISDLSNEFCDADAPPCISTPGCPSSTSQCSDGKCVVLLGQP